MRKHSSTRSSTSVTNTSISSTVFVKFVGEKRSPINPCACAGNKTLSSLNLSRCGLSVRSPNVTGWGYGLFSATLFDEPLSCCITKSNTRDVGGSVAVTEMSHAFITALVSRLTTFTRTSVCPAVRGRQVAVIGTTELTDKSNGSDGSTYSHMRTALF